MNPNSTPPEGLCACEAAEQGETAPGEGGVENVAQAGVQAPDPRAVLLDTISTALNSAGYWLPIDGKKAVAEAVLKTRDEAASRTAKRLTRWREMYEELEAADQRIRDLHRNDGGLCAECSTEQRGALWPCNTVAALDPTV